MVNVDNPECSGLLLKYAIQVILICQWFVRMWEVIPHSKDTDFPWALWYCKGPRSIWSWVLKASKSWKLKHSEPGLVNYSACLVDSALNNLHWLIILFRTVKFYQGAVLSFSLKTFCFRMQVPVRLKVIQSVIKLWVDFSPLCKYASLNNTSES